MKSMILFSIVSLGLTNSLPAAEPLLRVVVWDEQQPAQKQAYENFLGNAIAEHLTKQPGLRVVSANIDQPDKGLPASLLENTDILVYWGHARHNEISKELAEDIVARINRGELSMVALHSAHWSNPFMEAMYERTRQEARRRYPDPENGPPVKFEFIAPEGKFLPTADSIKTPAFYAMKRGPQLTVRVDLPNCVFPSYRNDGQPSTVKVLQPDHPIARGLPESFELPQTEMYADPFHVPDADAALFEESWILGEKFRSGLIWKIGKGHVFYFRPGHETYPIYKQELPLKIVANAVNWLGTQQRIVGSVLGKNITVADIGLTEPIDERAIKFDSRNTAEWNLMGRIMSAFGGEVLDRFIKERKIAATAEEIEQFRRNSQKMHEKNVRERKAKLAELNQKLTAPEKLSELEQKKLRDEQAMYERLVAASSDEPAAGALDEIARGFIVSWKIERELQRKYGGRVIFQQFGLEALDGRRRLFEEAEKKGDIKFDDQGVRHMFYYYANMKHIAVDENALERPWFLGDVE